GTGGSVGKVLSWNTSTGQQPDVLVDGIGPILSLAYRPDGRMFAVGTRDRKVWLHDMDADRSARTDPLTLDDRVWAVAFSPDGQTLLTGIEKRYAELWDLTTAKRKSERLRHESGVYAVAYSPDGRTVLTGSEDSTAQLWDATTTRPLGAPLIHNGTVYAV